MNHVNYDEISRTYDDVREPETELIREFLKELPLSGALSILDIGCGTGNYTDLFQKLTQERHFSFFGIDPSAGMLGKARQKNTRITYRVGSAEQLPAPSGFFDFVYMTDVIHHVPDIQSMFVEIFRVLKRGGRLCIVTQSHQQIERRPIAQFFPGTVLVDQARYPDIPVIIQDAEKTGLEFLKQQVLFEGEKVELGTGFLELVRKMGYSMLHLLAERDYQKGLLALEAALKNGTVQAQSPGETLVWFGKER